MSQEKMNTILYSFLIIVGSYLLITGKGDARLKGTHQKIRSSILIRVVGAAFTLLGIFLVYGILS
jgi:hypothetical protein